jgi:predicted hotdog family 3-hydroxylacyl-ACP dehydratase
MNSEYGNGFPASAESLVPHRPPMLLIDRVMDERDASGTVEATVRPDGILTDAGGRLDRTAHLEIIAQACAAIDGYRALGGDKGVRQGYLVGVGRQVIHGDVFAGDLLRVVVTSTNILSGFSLSEGKIFRGGELVSEASLKLWIPEDGQESD